MSTHSVLSPPSMHLWLSIRYGEIKSADTTQKADENAIEKKLIGLCEALYQFTPHLQIYVSEYSHNHGVLLEVSRSLTLFGGIKKLINAIHARITLMRGDYQQYHFAMAHTAQAAWLCSFSSTAIDLEKIENSSAQGNASRLRTFFHQQLKGLPITCIEDYPRTLKALQQTGFILLGDLIHQIHTSGLRSFTKRFGNEFSQYLSDMLDISQDMQHAGLFSAPTPVFHPEIPFIARLDLEFPVAQLDLLQPALSALLQKLNIHLQQRQLQCQTIEWHLISIYQERETLQIYSDTPQQHSGLLLELSMIQLEQYTFHFAVDQLELHCPFTTALQAQAYHLDFSQQSPSHKTTRDFTLTTAKLKARLGNGAIYKISYKDDHLPELSNDVISYQKPAWQVLPEIQQQALRPKWLFTHPQMIELTLTGLIWRGKLQLLAGPERIHTHWWDTPTARDYFMAQRHDGVRLWIFKDLQQQCWFVHGIFC